MTDDEATGWGLDQLVSADRQRDPAEVARLQALVARILARRGAGMAGARRAEGWSNLTCLTDGLVVRVAPEPGHEDLLREARLAAVLPPEVGYPRVIDSGILEGHAWVLAEQAPG